MRFRLTENLKNQAYMLRNDGKVFSGIDCDIIIHPYIFDRGSNIVQAFQLDYKSFIGYYFHTLNNEIKNDILALFKNGLNLQLNVTTIDNLNSECRDFYFSIKNNISDKTFSKEELINKYVNVQSGLNQEFLRFRFGGEFGGKAEGGSIYFRVSSVGFNGFDLIGKLVYENKNQISDITIETDENSGRDYKIYSHGRYKFNHLDTETFIMLKGNPIIEDYKELIKNNLYINILENLKSGKLPHECIKGNCKYRSDIFNLLLDIDNCEF